MSLVGIQTLGWRFRGVGGGGIYALDCRLEDKVRFGEKERGLEARNMEGTWKQGTISEEP